MQCLVEKGKSFEEKIMNGIKALEEEVNSNA